MICRRLEKITVLTLITALMLTVFFIKPVYSSSAEKTGQVDSAIGLNVRSGAGTGYPVVTGLADGERVKILSEVSDGDGNKWYNIETLSGIRGFVSASYIIVIEQNSSSSAYEVDGNFEEYLTGQGFPESYKPYLRELHAVYPNWVFTAKNTQLDWNDVIARESKLGISLVAGSLPDYYKSNDPGAFNSDGSYKSFDSGSWHAASKSAIAYYMDPRNFLTKNRIFQFISHRFDAEKHNIAGLNLLLKGTFMEGEYPKSEGEITEHRMYADVIYDAGCISGVNPYVLSAMILVEQGTRGVGGCISGTEPGYEGYYNYYNIGAYRAGSLTAVQRGLSYASGSGSYLRPWNTREKAITGGALWYFNNYVDRNKDSLYLKKWNVMNGISYVGVGQYMSNIQGAYLEASNLYRGYENVLNDAMTFEIPVYTGMPEEASPLPSESDIDAANPAEEAAAEEARLRELTAQRNAELSEGVALTSIKLKSEYYYNSKGRKSIRINWEKQRAEGVGYKVDYYEVFRSEKRYSGYTDKPFFTTKNGKALSYINTKSLERGKIYFYKVRGVRILRDFDGNETVHYTAWSNKAYRLWR